jgi:hypothetical protein
MCGLSNIQIPKYSNPLDIFGYKRFNLIEKFLKKVLEDEYIQIVNLNIQKKLETEFLDCYDYPIKTNEITILVINYRSSYFKGLYWYCSVKSQIEEMIVNTFSLENIGINRILLVNIDENENKYLSLY